LICDLPSRQPKLRRPRLYAPTFVDFCKRLLHDAAGPVYIIVDRHLICRATAVKDSSPLQAAV
jgi:hypothetical protein